MSKTCLIHIGTPKTGTSSLQASLFAARKELLKNNVNYFDFVENHNILKMVFETRKGKDVPLINPQVSSKTKSKAALLQAIKSNKSDTFIISGEALSMLPKDGVRDLKDFLNPYFDNFKIVAYFREPFGFASSAAQQLVKSGSYSEAFIGNTLKRSNPGWGNVLPYYRRRVENYINEFGRENIIAKDFTRKNLINENVIDDFLTSVLNYSGNLKKIKRIKRNESLDGDLVRILEELNVNFPVIVDKKKNPERSESIFLKLRSFSQTIENKKYVLANLDLDAFSDVIKEDVDWLAKTCGVKFDLNKKPDWKAEPINTSKIAGLINHLCLLTEGLPKTPTNQLKLQEEHKSLNEKFSDMKSNTTTLQNRYELLNQEHAVLKQCLLISQGKGNQKHFTNLLNTISNIEVLKTATSNINSDKNENYLSLITDRIAQIQSSPKKKKSPKLKLNVLPPKSPKRKTSV